MAKITPHTQPTITITAAARPVTAEIATVPVAPSPHRALTAAIDRLTELRGPPPSSAITGMTKNVAIARAAPAIHTAILPPSGTRSSTSRRIRPTVAVTRLYPRMGPIRRTAAARPSPTLVSSPRSERTAHETSATLKKVAGWQGE